jgi:hypothetical protein
MKPWHVVTATLAIGAYIAWILLFPVYTSRFRLSVEVETPQGLKSGSSVIETTIRDVKVGLPEMRGLSYGARGEAVFVDLGQGRHVIALLTFGAHGQDQDRLNGLVWAALAPGKRGNWREQFKLTGSGDLPPDSLPTLVTFADVNDPTTARVVQPQEFESVFGPGIRFKRAWLETVSAGIWPLSLVGITGEPITSGLERKLPWLPHPRYLSGRFACSPREPHCLHGGHFTR